MLNIATALPEMFIAGMACLILMYRLFDNSCCPNFMPFVMSVSTLALAGLMAINGQTPEAQLAFNGAFIADQMSSVIKAFIAFISAVVFIYGARYNAERGYFKTEFYVLGLFGVTGMMVMSSAAH
ncbi:MAG: hypothetical protein KAG66_11910, partial [Methylococcales bacterium]|nr:hypothetical protein [Methylococcales bacterium]